MTHPRPTPLFLALAALTAADIAAAPVLRMVLAADGAQGVKTVSFVKNPAIEKGWVALSALPDTHGGQSKRYHLSSDTTGPDAQVLTGPALIPGQKILRLSEEKKPFHILFEAEEIQAIARRFAAEGHHNSSNQDHATALAGNVFYESWIVTDPANDKAAALGIDVPAGTWMLSAHIPDAAFWEAEVKSGNITGFSIEGLFDQEALTLAAAPAPISMKKNWIFTALAAMAKVAGIKLTKTELKNGDIVDVADDGTVSELDADGNITGPAKDGPYELPDGTMLDVKDGKKVMAMAADPAAADEPADMSAAHTKVVEALTAAATETDPAKLVAAITQAITDLGGTAPTVDTTKLSAVVVQLEAVPLEGGKSVNFDPMTRKLTDEAGALLPSGDYKRTDGTCFRVNTDQYCYEIPAADYKAIAEAAVAADTAKTELAAVKLKLEAAELQLSATPGALRVSLGGDGGQSATPAKAKTTAERYALAALAGT